MPISRGYATDTAMMIDYFDERVLPGDFADSLISIDDLATIPKYANAVPRLNYAFAKTSASRGFISAEYRFDYESISRVTCYSAALSSGLLFIAW